MYRQQLPALSSLSFRPGTNDEPLQFRGGEREPDRKRKRYYLQDDTGPMCSETMPMSDSGAWNTAMTNLGMALMGMSGEPEVPEFDRGLEMENQFLLPPMVKEIIHCATCTLFPPNPNLPPPPTRSRPPGCKTVFVGGLPENATEHTVRDVLDPCGEIVSVRRGGTNYCHVRFIEEISVDRALYLSGYRIRIGSSSDRMDAGHLHVDFAQAREDLYEWECLQRALAREERHRRRMEDRRLRPPSPPPILHYSEHEGSIVAERLKDNGTFQDAVHMLLMWLERGEVNRQSANNFYSMIQSANSHVRRLQSEKSEHQRMMEESKEEFKHALTTILQQFDQILGVFHSASKQKARDHFSKAQRKNLNMWWEHAQEVRRLHSEELLGIRCEEEMEMSDEETEGGEQRRPPDQEVTELRDALDSVLKENQSLRCQMDAYRNELNLLRLEMGRRDPPGPPEEVSVLQEGVSVPQESAPEESKVGGRTPQEPQAGVVAPHESTPEEPQTGGISSEESMPEVSQESSPEDSKEGGSAPQESMPEEPKKGVSAAQDPQEGVSVPQEDMPQQLLPLQAECKRKKQEIQDLRASETQPEMDSSPNTEAERDHDRPSPPSCCTETPKKSKSVSPRISETTIITDMAPAGGEPPPYIGDSPVRSEREALLVGIISTFLHVHPRGASMEYICSYLQQVDSKVQCSTVSGNAGLSVSSLSSPGKVGLCVTLSLS